MSYIYVGIDPGKTGAVAVIDETKIHLYDTPTIKVGKKNQYILSEMVRILYEVKHTAILNNISIFV